MDFDHGNNDLADRRKTDFDDLQNETAGRETGRISRFLPDGEGSPQSERKKREADHALQTALDILMQDPVYRERYDGVLNDLRDAEQATDAALEQNAQMRRETARTIDDMEESAARLPDGALAFRDEDGLVRHTDGSEVDDTLAQTILWTSNEPSFEEYREQQDRLSALTTQQHEVETYRDDVLGSARHRLTDPDDPPELNELDSIQDAFMSGMPSAVAERMPVSDDVHARADATADAVLPTLGPLP